MTLLRDFWMAVYIAATRNGDSDFNACQKADSAAREFMKRNVEGTFTPRE